MLVRRSHSSERSFRPLRPGWKRVRLDDRSDGASRLFEVPVAVIADPHPPAVGGSEVEHHLHRGRLARTVRTEKTGHPSGRHREAEIVDDDVVAVPLGDVFDVEAEAPALQLVHGVRRRSTAIASH
jgi:hypothetical protein